MPSSTSTTFWIVSTLAILEYVWGASRPDSDEPRWSFERRAVLLRFSATLAVGQLAVAPVLSFISAAMLAVALALREVLRALVVRWRGRQPFSREAIFFVAQWFPISIWLVLPGRDFEVASVVGRYYDNSILSGALVLLAGFVLATFGGAIWVRALLDQLETKPSDFDGDSDLRDHARWALGQSGEENEIEASLRAGRVIGYLERILIFAMVLADQWTAVGFILTAKSVARFKRLEKQEFAEYYLVGTLTSTLIALAAALGVRAAWAASNL